MATMRLVGLFLALTLLPFPALAQKRVALVIGNGVYNSQNRLDNPPSDALLISQALTKARFGTIETKINLGIAEFRQALRRFQSQANGADVALVYFAGHGIEANGANWLIPTDAELNEDRDLDYEAIKADLVLQALQGARMRVLVLDACRGNPFGRHWRASVRSTTNGLAKLEADDVLVLFAAAPGQTASDGNSANSPFAEALAKRLPEPGLAIQLLGGNVRDDVLAATGGNQRPYVSASITGKPFYLVPEERPPAEVRQAPTQGQLSDAAEAWAAIENTTNIAALELFIASYKDTYYAGLAHLRIEELKKQQIAVAAPPSASRTPSFDGTWLAAMECPAIPGGLGYGLEFEVLIKDGVLHGEAGLKGKPGWRALDGKIDLYGSGSIRERGLTGSSMYTGGDAPGTGYAFTLAVDLKGTRGTGKRRSGRDCRYTFTKQ